MQPLNPHVIDKYNFLQWLTTQLKIVQCVNRFAIHGTRNQVDILLLLLIVDTNFSSFCICRILVFGNQIVDNQFCKFIVTTATKNLNKIT